LHAAAALKGKVEEDATTKDEEAGESTRSVNCLKSSGLLSAEIAEMRSATCVSGDPMAPDAYAVPQFNASTVHMLVFGALWLHLKPEHRKLANCVLLKKWLVGALFGFLGALPVAQACLLLAVEAVFLGMLVVKRPYRLHLVYAAEVAFSVGTALVYLVPLAMAFTALPPVVLTTSMLAQLLLCGGFVLANLPRALRTLRDTLPKCREKWYDDYRPTHVGMRTGVVYRHPDGTSRVERLLGLDDACAREEAKREGAVFVRDQAPVRQRWKHHFQVT
jgi:hypothetical protein